MAIFRNYLEELLVGIGRSPDDATPPDNAPVDVTGDRSDGTALENLLTALADLGLITDSTIA